MSWNKVECQANCIIHSTGRADLIKIPTTNWEFWHPSKLVRQYGKSGYMISISYTDDFTFNLKKKSKSGKSIVEEIEISGSEFADYFYNPSENGLD